MLANFFAKSKPVNFIIIIGFFFCYFLVVNLIQVSTVGFSSDYFLKIIGFFLLFLVIFFAFNFIVIKNKLTYDNSYAFLFFVLFLILFLNYLLDFKTLVMFLLYLIYVRKVYGFQFMGFIFKKLFNAGFWLGVLFILEPFTIVFFPLLYLSIFLHQKENARTLLIPIIGFIAPLILYFTYCFWYNSTEDFLALFYFFTEFDVSIYTENQFLTPLLLISFCIIIALILKTPKIISISTTFRKSWILIFFNLIFSIVFIVFSPIADSSEIIFFLFPVAIIVTNGFESIKKNFIKNIVLIAFLVFATVFPFIA